MYSIDWNKAAQIIRERKPVTVEAGLSEDWSWTAGTIYENGGPVNGGGFLSSRWATPEIHLYFTEDQLEYVSIECSKDGDGPHEWPEEAKVILMEGEGAV